MKKTELLKEVATKAETTSKVADSVITALTDVIITETTAGRDIKVTGLGTFKPAIRSPREGVNPATKERVTHPEKAIIKFKIEKGFSSRFSDQVTVKELKKAMNVKNKK